MADTGPPRLRRACSVPPPQQHPPPTFLRAARRALRKAYRVNDNWLSVTGKTVVVGYLALVWLQNFLESPAEFFFYLTFWAWTVELGYFAYALYLDIRARWTGILVLPPVASAVAQALSELVFAVQVVVVSFFWLVVYPQETWRSVGREFILHGTGLVLIIIDYAYRVAGWQIRNHKYICWFAACYTIVHVTVVLYRKVPIYPGMAFDNLFSVLIFLLGLTTVTIIHKLIYLITNWAHIKQDIKTAVGISKFLLLVPRQNSMEFLSIASGDESEGSTEVTRQCTSPASLNVPKSPAFSKASLLSPRLHSPTTLRTPESSRSPSSSTLRRRVVDFVGSEILLIPSGHRKQ